MVSLQPTYESSKHRSPDLVHERSRAQKLVGARAQTIFDEKFRLPHDNPTIGIILATGKDKTMVKYSVLNDNPQLFASVYQLYMPTEQELQTYVETTLAYLD